MDRKLAEWFASDDTGMSSKAIALYLASAVVALFFATSIGALLLAIAFRRWNKRMSG